MALKVHLDTSAYASFLRNEPTAVFVVERAPELVLSPIVVGELKAGFAVGRRTRDNLRLLERFLASPRVSLAQLDDRVTDNYARIFKQLRSQRRPIPTNDLWIAATLRGQDEALFSRDALFEHVDGLRLIRSGDDLRALLS